MTKKKANKYYNKLFKYSAEFHHEKNIEAFINKKIFEDIILNNKEYMITDSFLNFVASDSRAIAFFSYVLSDDIYNRHTIFDLYFYSIYSDYESMDKHSQCDYHLYTKALDEDTKKATILAREYNNKMRSKYYLQDGFNIMNNFFIFILSYCYERKIMNEYEAICEPLIRDPEAVIAYFYNNGVNHIGFNGTGRTKFFFLMENMIENRPKKIIK